MTEHVPKPRLERFCARVLPEPEFVSVAEHLVVCQVCHELFVDTLRAGRGVAPLRLDLSPASAAKHEHLEYEQLVDYADYNLDEIGREMTDLHLEHCVQCREALRNFLEFRRDLVTDLQISYAPAVEESQEQESGWRVWWRALSWQPTYAGMLLLIGAAIIISVVLLRRSGNNSGPQQVQNTGISSEPAGESAGRSEAIIPTTPSALTPPEKVPSDSHRLPTTPASPERAKAQIAEKHVNNASTEITLTDGGGQVIRQENGRIDGLEGAPANTRRDVADVLIAQRFEKPGISVRLAPDESALRGDPGQQQSFKLLTPARSVVIEDRPLFNWEALPGASGYTVYVIDSSGGEAAKGESPAPSTTHWTPAAPLMRGRVYSWYVVANVNGKEVISPNSAAPEVRFQILSSDDLKKLSLLKKEKSHLALGVFYVKTGLLKEAEEEFRQLVLLNPNSEVAQKLFHSVRLMLRTE